MCTGEVHEGPRHFPAWRSLRALHVISIGRLPQKGATFGANKVTSSAQALRGWLSQPPFGPCTEDSSECSRPWHTSTRGHSAEPWERKPKSRNPADSLEEACKKEKTRSRGPFHRRFPVRDANEAACWQFGWPFIADSESGDVTLDCISLNP